jgi:hypothetical protein
VKEHEMEELSWEYRPEWAGWWLMIQEDGVTADRGFGPFNETEAKWAAEVHGVPFLPPPPKEQK